MCVGPPGPAESPSPAIVDFSRIDAENRALGNRGEEFVFELERRRLHDEERRPDLAKRVSWRARDEGDGLGYDILSFERTGVNRLIEVKTTGAGIYTQFVLTRNELSCSQENADRYQLYRLFDFGSSPRLYVLTGALDRTCTLTPTQFRAAVGRATETVDQGSIGTSSGNLGKADQTPGSSPLAARSRRAPTVPP